MKKILYILTFLLFAQFATAQELLANVNINTQQLPGSNVQTYKVLERDVRDFINKTSWTGKTLENFEKVKCNFSMIITGRDGNRFSGSIVVQSVRPVFNSTYESPILNINDTKMSFEYVENENLIFNERQFSGKNLTDIISFYVYLILGYDADTFQQNGGQQHFAKALLVSQNAQNRGYDGWSQIDGPKSRGSLIDDIVNPNFATLHNINYAYHRSGLDNMYLQDQSQPKKIIADALLKLKTYESTFQQNYAINLFLDVKSPEIFNIFDSNNNGAVNMQEIKQLMTTFSPKNIDTKWSKWK
ncbi:type IX secretion system protein PorD [Frigoriflavimonas asaccharolytica]|uniref:EF-hand domain-containing protein n=1 Tax=Frigoriflavimonas asaccharolytica TaxID=2735899 RepID=A0A8J8GBA3_9FLAO|nr:DUF4835 family protein [Frigoriflavimonas asaccharolytica]NRS93372.1 hypothetical protein [Frigoriflavimonas asaccharolytica]